MRAHPRIQILSLTVSVMIRIGNMHTQKLNTTTSVITNFFLIMLNYVVVVVMLLSVYIYYTVTEGNYRRKDNFCHS